MIDYLDEMIHFVPKLCYFVVCLVVLILFPACLYGVLHEEMHGSCLDYLTHFPFFCDGWHRRPHLCLRNRVEGKFAAQF